MVKPLTLQDQHHLQAAQGWLESGNHLEANEELGHITASNRAHPAILEVRYLIYDKAKKWDAALDIASALVQTVPDQPLGWVHRSYCLHELKRSIQCCAFGVGSVGFGSCSGPTRGTKIER